MKQRCHGAAFFRASTPEQFANIIVKSDNRGRVTRVRDIGRVEIGAADYGSTAYMDRSNATALLIYAEPGANSWVGGTTAGARAQAWAVRRGARRNARAFGGYDQAIRRSLRCH
jgi:hypothetical protein